MNEKQFRNTYIKLRVQFTSHLKQPAQLAEILHDASLKTEDPTLVKLYGDYMAEIVQLPKDQKSGRPKLHTGVDPNKGGFMTIGRECTLNAPYFSVVDALLAHTEEALESDREPWAAIAFKEGWRPQDEIQ